MKSSKNNYQDSCLAYLYPIWRRINRPWLHRKLIKNCIASLDLRSGDSVLEIACGPGYSLKFASAAVGELGQVEAIDIASSMLRIAHRRSLKISKNIRILKMNAEEITYKESFDGVFSVLGISCISNWRQSLQKMKDACKVGGRVCVVDAKKGCSLMSAKTLPIMEEFEVLFSDIEIEVHGVYFIISGTKT